MLYLYTSMTPGIQGSDNASLILDDENEVQPDTHLRVDPSLGGQSYINQDGYLEGAPELIIEVAGSSVSYDLNSKKWTYAYHGIREYVVIQTYEQKVSWFVLQNQAYVAVEPDERGIFRSQIFPGLWLNEPAYWAKDRRAVLLTLQEGMNTSAYTKFVERLS